MTMSQRGAPESEFSEPFVEAMRDRMAVSFFKYGPVAEGYPHRVDAVASLKKRLDRYAETGNTEWLVDAANFAMIEYMHPRHTNAHFRGTDSHESPGRETHDADMSGRAMKNRDLLTEEELARDNG